MLYPLIVNDIVKATGGKLICGNGSAVIKAVSTDSRTLTAETLFIPIKGEKFDGHDFLGGATIAITERDVEPAEGKTFIRTGNTIEAFGAIARFYKEKYPVPTISVVGSVGKTTTRDMIASVMSQKYKTLKTEKNYNNNIGVPIMVMKLEEEHEAAVLELGMSALGEIEYLADIVRPDTLVMTNIGMSHIENLGSQENIFKAKMEGTKYLTSENVVIANFDDEFLKTVGDYGDYKVISYGVDNKWDVTGINIKDLGFNGCEFDILFENNTYHVHLNIPGVHNVYNALAAFAAGYVHGLLPEEIVRGLESAGFTAMRMEIKECDGLTIINDCYNASPSSVEAALNVLKTENKGRKVAVLGDIFELGDFAPEAHRNIGMLAKEIADVIVCVGDNAAYIKEGAEGVEQIYYINSTDKAENEITHIINSGDTILLKASRGMHFEKLFKKLTEGQK